MLKHLLSACLALLAVLSACGAPSPGPALAPAPLAAMDAAIADALVARKTPGAVLWVERDGAVHRRACGALTYAPDAAPVDDATIFDAASLTKVVATTTAVMQLVERGRLELDAPVARYLPAFARHGKEAVTVRQLLTHMSGLRPDLDTKPAWSGYDTGVALATEEKLRSVPGGAFVYSDIGFIVLGELVRLADGRPLNVYATEEIFRPLGMHDSSFLPTREKLPRIAPTELLDGQPLHGVVHDPTTRMMGGVAGHAGLFTTAADLARFCRMILNGGELDGVRLLRPETVAEMTRVQNDGNDRRGLGWDLDSRFSGNRGRWFPAGRSFGHTGYTGTSLWIDPGSRTFWIFLTNRVHPDDKANIGPLRRQLATLAAEAAGVDRTAVLQGIDVLVRDAFAPLRGLRVGLITNQSGRDRDNRPTIDLLAAAPGVQLVALFSPEHGIRGTADDAIGDTIDEKTKLPVYSLYRSAPPRPPGQSDAERAHALLRARAPQPEQLANLDALVFDVQDIGARFYTYPATLGVALEAAARAGKKFFVLDRINPINGRDVEGPLMTSLPGFTGFHPLPIRHGLTLGELARLLNAELGLGADLHVIACENWSRDRWFDETGLSWINPSPSMRSPTAATLYPGLCLLESTSVSVGRGTLHPFEQIGAPYIDGEQLAAALNAAGLPGVRFEPVRFTPQPALYPGPAHLLKLADRECGGVRVHVTDRENCAVVDVGFLLALTLHRLYPDNFQPDAMARLLANDAVLADLKAGKSLGELKATWAADLAAYATRRRPFLLY